MKVGIGSRVKIVGEHPWSGCTGKIVGGGCTILGTPGLTIALDDAEEVPPGQECMVFSASKLQLLEAQRKDGGTDHQANAGNQGQLPRKGTHE